MNWEKLIPILENACKKVESIKDIDERLAELIFIVAEIVEETEREACAKVLADRANHIENNHRRPHYGFPYELRQSIAAIRARKDA
jgi:hypothetical protein